MNKRIQKHYTISIFLPSRKRLKNLKSTIDSLLSLADPGLSNFEILVKLDFDDSESIEYIKNINNDFENITFVVNSRLKGWYNLVDFNEDLIHIAKGKYVFGINDDTLIATKDWNRILEGVAIGKGVGSFWYEDCNQFIGGLLPAYQYYYRSRWRFFSQ